MLIDDPQGTLAVAVPGDPHPRRPLPLATERMFGAEDMFLLYHR